MTKADLYFHELGDGFDQAIASQMFGKKCYKFSGKAFICFFQDCMVFKLTGTDHAKALAMPGAQLFDPSGKGKPMKEWVQIPFDAASDWGYFARSSFRYVSSGSAIV